MFSLDPILRAMAEVDDARIALEEANESGDLEERLEAAMELEEAEKRLMSARLNDGN